MTVTSYVFSGYVVEEELELSLSELSQLCCVNAEWLMELVAEGVIEPLEAPHGWRFAGACIQRVRAVQRLQRDLGLNLPGAALTLELLDEIDVLRMRLATLSPHEV